MYITALKKSMLSYPAASISAMSTSATAADSPPLLHHPTLHPLPHPISCASQKMSIFKIQDYFIISSEKLKCGWTLTTVRNNTYFIF